MSYCRFENTVRDLQDCYENWNDATSESEIKARAKILKIARDLVDDFGFETKSKGTNPPTVF